MAVKTLTELINMKTRFDVDKVTYFTATEDGSLIVPDVNVFSIYMRYIMQYVTEYNVSITQREEFKYRPDLLSAKVYGTPRLSWLVMMLNDRESPSRFILKKTIRMIPVDDLEMLYDTVITKSNDTLTANWDKYLSRIEE